MYFKKQLYFALFIAIILAATFYKDTNNQNTFESSELVTVTVVDLHCIGGIKKAKINWIDINYQGQTHQLDLSKQRCNSFTKGDTLSLKYDEFANEFLLPELLTPGYYTTIYIILGVLLAIALIPYRSII